AAQRLDGVTRRANAPMAPSHELFFHVSVVHRATATLLGSPGFGDAHSGLKGDRLLADITESIARLGGAASAAERQRAITALAHFARGREAFVNGGPSEARTEFSAAEQELNALGIPIALLARDQRIRSECWLAASDCVANLLAFRAEVQAPGKYPWLAARAAHAAGQANYRAGRIYDAAGWFQRAQTEFRRVGDELSATYMHSLLANALAAAGETDLALAEFVAAIRGRTEQVSDRRRKQLEDAMMFLLRHGFIAAAEAILDELAAAPSTEAARVMESTLRGVLAVRRGDIRSAAASFDHAREQLQDVADQTARDEVRRALVIAQAGSGAFSASAAVLEDLDRAVAVDQKDEISVWLPQLLMQRGAAFEERGDAVRAEQDYRRAIGILEGREPRIDQTMLSLGIVYDGESPFDRAIRLLLRQGRLADALSISERAAGLRISALHTWGTGVADVFAAGRQSVPAGDIAAIRAALQPGEIAVAYHLLREELVTWTVTKDQVTAIRRGIRGQDVIDAVERLRACARRRACDHDAASGVVSSLFVRDWIDRTPRDATLLIRQPAEVQAVPFAMLRSSTRERLLERNAVATAPAFRTFVRARRIDGERSGATAAFFAAAARPGGDRPYLPQAASEVQLASRFHPGAVVDTQATRARFLERAPASSMIHFAGHAVVNDEQPMLSALVFDPGEESQDTQMLHMHELNERTFARARLVVLAACETGWSPRPTVNLADALLSQGVPAVVYTLWPVDDETAASFAVEFHRMLAEGRSRAEAVRVASLSLLETHPDRPDIWAAFALAGVPGPLDVMTKGAVR
ncbi:MAG TPA: CHAT domain-containing protein, partial [Thermoanaerobaculia bacterium]